MKKDSKEKMNLRERIDKALDIPPDFLPSETNIVLRGRNSLTVSGTKKILLYTPDEIRLELYESTLSVKGQRLICSSYHKDATGIDGQIVSVTFEDLGEG